MRQIQTITRLVKTAGIQGLFRGIRNKLMRRDLLDGIEFSRLERKNEKKTDTRDKGKHCIYNPEAEIIHFGNHSRNADGKGRDILFISHEMNLTGAPIALLSA